MIEEVKIEKKFANVKEISNFYGFSLATARNNISLMKKTNVYQRWLFRIIWKSLVTSF
ncbi:hypothetical protein [Lactovum miscens]|uniref:Fic family protein n=1 Tax=Lactovum miscens TaxID=190387 RepID=A0A841C9S9_9LACT|nr:hypothetical protein [Lactovum miscens]MBB5888342.1 Fic family protein [Lactovum miscens]